LQDLFFKSPPKDTKGTQDQSTHRDSEKEFDHTQTQTQQPQVENPPQ